MQGEMQGEMAGENEGRFIGRRTVRGAGMEHWYWPGLPQTAMSMYFFLVMHLTHVHAALSIACMYK